MAVVVEDIANLAALQHYIAYFYYFAPQNVTLASVAFSYTIMVKAGNAVRK